ncbi:MULTISPECIES: glycosyltransferase family 61 protein [Oceanobacillus]|uniref:Glycosyltransferase family 61 protein n=1 Tax=Oceanobacillus aidingensis TaxID=645964 RepID=A0ABV9K3E8_9BACI|nr:glycosyltransferase family 61 protein [Oceanobacillus oncorhynchi]MDM8099680.1 glycosyltransferase family 61 protein [Oceanobacillus oncorhynchi]UUI41869.1 glycosyltransferase family 61 protein [Oceanobacillus oncorhynchi]
MVDLSIHTKDWLEKITPKADIHEVYKEFYTDETVTYTLPKGDSPEWVDWVKPPTFGEKHRFEKAYVSKIENGSVWMCDKGEGMVYALAPNHTYFHDMVFHLYWNYFDKIAVKSIPSVSPYEGTLGVLAWAGHANYWHWLHDTLGRYHLLQLSGFKIDKYVLPPLTLPFQRETIKLLGIPEEKILQLTPGMHVQAEQLILPSVPFNAGTCVKWTIEFLRSALLKKDSYRSANPEKRIYISREDASWRKVANEGKLLELLTRKGFKKIVLSTLTVEEQIALFSSADVIISPNGAGLANLMFCQPRTKIIQLFTATSDEFIKIGQYLDLDYHFLKCRNANPVSTEHEVIKNLVVDVKKIAEILKEEGID